MFLEGIVHIFGVRGFNFKMEDVYRISPAYSDDYEMPECFSSVSNAGFPTKNETVKTT